MKETPIIFSTPMVQAILNGRKTQTRRIVKFPHHAYTPNIDWIKQVHQDGGGNWIAWSGNSGFEELKRFTKKAYPNGEGFKCPYGQVGDLLYVKETFMEELGRGVVYRASNPECGKYFKWKPSIFMPKKYARIWLENTALKVEKLQDISEEDEKAEGMDEPDYGFPSYRCRFRCLWDSINGKKYPWKSNPWVWVVEFKPTNQGPAAPQ